MVVGKFSTLTALAICIALVPLASGMQITGFQPAVHNRFQSGFPNAPVRNADTNFIGKNFDWTSVGWASNNPRQGNGYLSPRHHLAAKHFNSINTRRIYGNDNVIHSVTFQNRVDLGLGVILDQSGEDAAITRLASAYPVSAQMPRYAVLDLNNLSGSNNPGNYNGRSVLLYGHWGLPLSSTGSTRIGQTSISSATINGTEHRFLTPRTAVQLEEQDSSSPAFLPWTNPDGGQELTIIGNHAATDTTNGVNFHNFIGSHEVMTAINGVMTPDGYALRVVGEPTNTWVGSQNISITINRSWGLGGQASAPTDRFVIFNGSTAGNGRQVNVNDNHNLRGLYFRNSGSTSLGFQFNDTSTLTIGRGGVMNLDGSPQVFEAPLALGDHQYWDAGAGGVSIRNVATNGRLLNIRSAGPSMIRGNVSGSGGLALEGGQLHIEASNSYTGKTWVHDGTLRVDGDLRTSEVLIFDTTAVLTGHGKLPAIQGRGAIVPDGILSATSLAPTSGMSMHFRFSSDAPVYESVATSPNNLLRLTGPTPVSPALSANQTVAIYLENSLPDAATSLQGGLFFDDPATTATSFASANWQVYVADPNGLVVHQGGTYSPVDRSWTLSLEPETAAFAEGSVNGKVLQLNLAAAPGTYDAWADTVFPELLDEAERAPDASPLGDGITNLIAYALGLDPLAEKTTQMPEVEHLESNFLFRYRNNLVAQDLEVVVETSENLTQWDEVLAEPIVVDPDVDQDGNVRMLQVSIPKAPLETRRFARLRVNFANN